MSRSKKGKKSAGYEYWSKRPGSSNHGSVPGKESKRETHRLERIEKKKAIKESKDEN